MYWYVPASILFALNTTFTLFPVAAFLTKYLLLALAVTVLVSIALSEPSFAVVFKQVTFTVPSPKKSFEYWSLKEAVTVAVLSIAFESVADVLSTSIVATALSATTVIATELTILLSFLIKI